MARPHPALIELAAGRPMPPRVDDPERLLATALEHRMQGLFWSAMMRGEIELPLATERRLAVLDLRTQAHHRKLWDTLEEVIARLAEIGVEVVAFKGVTAEARWYHRMGERPSRDLDLWLSPYQLGRIDEVVDLLHPGHPLAGKVGEYAAGGYVQSVDLDVGDVDIDFHFDPIKLGIPFRQLLFLWDTADEMDGIRVMSKAGSTLLAAMHLLKDGFAELAPVVELVRLIELAPADRVWGLAREEGLDGWLDLVVESVVTDLRLDLPVVVDTPRSVLALRRLAFPSRRRLDGPQHLLRGSRAWYLIPFTASSRLSDGWAWALRKLRPPPDLASYNLTLLRGSRLFRVVRGSHLSRAAREVRRSE